MNRLGRVVCGAVSLAVMCVGSADAQLAPELSNWLQPLPSCRTSSCIVNNTPTSSTRGKPGKPWQPTGELGPITTTPEPLTIMLLGTGLAGIGLVARRRKDVSVELV